MYHVVVDLKLPMGKKDFSFGTSDEVETTSIEAYI